MFSCYFNIASFTNSAGDSFNIFFAIYGNCNDQCTSDGGPSNIDTEPPVVAPVAEPTDPPVEPTDPPVEPTDPPVEPTDPPVVEPADPPRPEPTKAPVKPPTEPEVEPPVPPASTPAPVEPPTTSGETPAPAVSPTTETTEAPTSSPISTGTTPAPTPAPASTSNLAQSRIAATMRLTPMSAKMSPDQLSNWIETTEQFILQSAGEDTKDMKISSTVQTIVEASNRSRNRRQLQQQQAVEISFTLDGTHDKNKSLSEIFLSAFDSESKQNEYLDSLKASDQEFQDLESVQAEVADGSDTNKDTSPDSGGSSSIGIIIGVVVGVVVVAGVGGFFVYRNKKKSQSKPDKSSVKASTKTSPSKQQQQLQQDTTASSSEPNLMLPYQQQQRWTNEIVVNQDSCDDISTLEGGTIYDGMTLGVRDDPTATVNLNYDDYKSTAEGTALSNLCKLGLGTAGVLEDDDASFEEQYARDVLENIDDDDDTKVKPFVVHAPPGLLGMVVESNGGVPMVRMIKGNSPLRHRVRVGDLVISVNRQDTSAMTAMEVSDLVSRQQHRERTLVFVRPEKPLNVNDPEF